VAVPKFEPEDPKRRTSIRGKKEGPPHALSKGDDGVEEPLLPEESMLLELLVRRFSHVGGLDLVGLEKKSHCTFCSRREHRQTARQKVEGPAKTASEIPKADALPRKRSRKTDREVIVKVEGGGGGRRRTG